MPKFDLDLKTPIMNAAGSLGFALDPNAPINLSQMGAFVTNPISLSKRTPARGPRLLVFSGGFLLHTGFPNPGLNRSIREYASRWRRCPLPVLVHLLVQSPSEVSRMVERLEGLAGVMGIELGLPPDSDPGLAAGLVSAAIGELPVIARLPLDHASDLAVCPGRLRPGWDQPESSPRRAAWTSWRAGKWTNIWPSGLPAGIGCR